jgi:hypothetical protein
MIGIRIPVGMSLLLALGACAEEAPGGSGSRGGQQSCATTPEGCAPAGMTGTAGDDGFGNPMGAGTTGGAVDASGPVFKDLVPQIADKADLLFVVDNSGSMREEQDALRKQFPRMIETLTGESDLGGDGEFVPIKDIHLGVVSSDMGLIGIDGIPGCEGLGDDGVLKHGNLPDDSACKGDYPDFIAYETGADTVKTGENFGCVATMGTEGCGFEQQLESALKALWPSVDKDPITGMVMTPNRIEFLALAGDETGKQGHADKENDGFLRNDPERGWSLVAVIVVTDEEDCSSANTAHFTPDTFLEETDPLHGQALNLRCFLNKSNLYNVDRYVNGYRALRPMAEQLVMFAAIAGVPPDLVNKEARSGVDFNDPAANAAYYQNILDDPRMKETMNVDGDNLVPSCQSGTGTAFPPRRLVEVAKGFGENSVLQSICQKDFRPAMDFLVERIGTRIAIRK